MNYLAHGYRHLHDPWFLAGTALPDWLRVLDRRARVPPDALRPFTGDADARVASMARGALRHHEDDRRFHGSEAFGQTRREVAAILRRALPAAEGHRPSFVAHLLLEVHLDAALLAEDPRRLDAYYAALGSLAPDDVDEVGSRLTPAARGRLGRLFEGFRRERFLDDYADDARLAHRLGQVMRRARQPALPPLAAVLPGARALVRLRAADLLPPRQS